MIVLTQALRDELHKLLDEEWPEDVDFLARTHPAFDQTPLGADLTEWPEEDDGTWTATQCTASFVNYWFGDCVPDNLR